MKALRFILGDQLTRSVSSLRGLDPAADVILMVEVAAEATYVRHHAQKIALLFSAMRHHRDALRAEGLTVDYVTLDDPDNTGAFTEELARAVARHRPDEVIVTEPGEWRVLEMMNAWRDTLGVPVFIREDDRFLISRADFLDWLGEKPTSRMEFFYREMRRRTGFLMEDGQPVGGQWNYDKQNRKALPAGETLPDRRRFEQNETTRGVIELVRRRFQGHFGDLDGFGWGVTRDHALEALEDFTRHGLPRFGDYQDAMKADEPFLFHGIVSPYLNCGLLTPREVCEAAIDAYREGVAPLNAVEGFVRQIVGWREYVRGVYWARMPAYAQTNALEARRPLPWFYWSGETEMRCLAQCIGATKAHAYAHHIQRLMVLGNFALIAGLSPQEVEEWYLVVYADAYEWVELPNVHGMILWADGGVMGSKPYAASGAYINRMSDYCGACRYDPDEKLGPDACPFNYLYWHFLIENEPRLAGNRRMDMPYRTLARIKPERRDAIMGQARAFLASAAMSPDEPPPQSAPC